MNTDHAYGAIVGLLMGDPSGVGPELVARVLAENKMKVGRVIVFGDPRVLRLGEERAGVQLNVQIREDIAEFNHDDPAVPCLKVPITDFDIDDFSVRAPNVPAGRYTMEVLRFALDAALARKIDAVAYGPMSKIAMNRAGWHFRDGIDVCTSHLGYKGVASELNVMDDLWVARVTSHVPLKVVPDLATKERIHAVISLLNRAMIASGITKPKIAVSGLNPHCGEDGLCGTEEIESVIPAIEQAKCDGIDVFGPISGDVIYTEARKNSYTGIVSMYHDQCQVANKLMLYETGIAVHGGSPVPTVTVGHGTAFDIVGTGKANPRGLIRAIETAAVIGSNRGLYDRGEAAHDASGQLEPSQLTPRA